MIARKTRVCRILAICFCIFATSGCRVLSPNFAALYLGVSDTQGSDEIYPPVIIIPGLLGSRLVDTQTGKEVWPGSAFDVAWGKYPDLVLDFDLDNPDQQSLVSAGIAESKLGVDFYGELLRVLEHYAGYERAVLGAGRPSPGQRRLYVFDYDWRQDNVRTVKKLHQFIQTIREDYASPKLKVDVIAHSMGGLMARYYLRFGNKDVLQDNDLNVTWAGAQAINKMILLGTPNLGSVSAIEGFIRGQIVGLRRIPEEVVATMPSTYQLFPHRIVDWLYDTSGQRLDIDQFDAAIWRELGWNIFAPQVRKRVVETKGADYYHRLTEHFARNAERARRFSWALTVCPNYDERKSECSEAAEPPVKLVVFGGNCAATPSRWVVETDGSGQRVVRFSPRQIRAKMPGVDYQDLMYDPGDGTVTKPSLLARDALSPNMPRHKFSYFPLAYSFLLCAKHFTLTGNRHFQANLLDVLLTRARPWELHKDHTLR